MKNPQKIISKVKPIFILELLCEDKIQPLIEMVLKAVMVILNEEQTSSNIIKVIGKKDFLERL